MHDPLVLIARGPRHGRDSRLMADWIDEAMDLVQRYGQAYAIADVTDTKADHAEVERLWDQIEAKLCTATRHPQETT